MYRRSIVLRLLYCITRTVQVTKARKYFPRGQNVGQQWVEVSNRVATIYDRQTL